MDYCAVMKELIGKTVIGLRINEEQDTLTFDHPDGTTTSYDAVGDSWTATWFADITGVSALIGGTVLNIEDICMDEVSVQDDECFYGVKLITNKGYVDIVYRNDDSHYGGYLRPRMAPLPDTMCNIFDDWSA